MANVKLLGGGWGLMFKEGELRKICHHCLKDLDLSQCYFCRARQKVFCETCEIELNGLLKGCFFDRSGCHEHFNIVQGEKN